MAHASDDNPSPRQRWIARLTRSTIGAAALLVAIIIAVILKQTAPQTEAADTLAAFQKAPVIRIEPVQVARQWSGHGTIEATETVDVPARVSAVVDTIPEGIDAGARVSKGQLLVQLDPEDFQRQVDIAQQNIENLQARLSQLDAQRQRLQEREALERELVEIATAERQRVERIYEQGATGQQGLDRARRGAIEAQRALTATLEQVDSVAHQKTQVQAQLASQRAQLRLAELGLERTRITSPIDGIIASVDVEPGESLAPGARVARVVDLRRIEVPFNVPSAARADLAIGDAVTLRTSARGATQWDARVARVAPGDDPRSRTATFFAELTQPNALEVFGTPEARDLLLPGSFVSGTVVSDRREQRWVVPRRSIRDGRVKVVRDGIVTSCGVDQAYTIQRQFPQFGISDDQWVVLERGGVPLIEGDLLIIDASMALPDGAEVEPTVMGEAQAVGAGNQESGGRSQESGDRDQLRSTNSPLRTDRGTP